MVLVSSLDKRKLYEFLIQEGVFCCKKDVTGNNYILDIKNLHCYLVMRSLKSRKFVSEIYSWQWHYYSLLPEGICFLREYLGLPSNIVPKTYLKDINSKNRDEIILASEYVEKKKKKIKVVEIDLKIEKNEKEICMEEIINNNEKEIDLETFNKNEKEILFKLEDEVKLNKIEDKISGIYIPNEILMESIQVKPETIEKINEIISSSKTEAEIFSKLDISNVISIDEEKTHHLLVSKVLSKTTEEDKKKSEEKMQDLSSKVFNKFATNSNHYENLLNGKTDSLEFAIVAINEMLKKTNNTNIIVSDKILSPLEEDHYMKYMCFGSEARENQMRITLSETPKYKFQSLKENVDLRNEFSSKLRSKILEKFPIEKGFYFDINTIMYGSNSLVINTNIDMNEIKNLMSHCEIEFGKIKSSRQEFNDDNIKFSANMLDSRGNYDFTNHADVQIRGGMNYHQPKGWKRFGLKVSGKFDGGNDSWLAMNGNSNEWAVGFHGTADKYILPIVYNNLKTGIHNACAGRINVNPKSNVQYPIITTGVYFGKKIEISDGYAPGFALGGNNFKMAFQCRIKPSEVQIVQNTEDYFVVKNDLIKTFDSIRPYGILIKKS